jgi:hypothetical protein
VHCGRNARDTSFRKNRIGGSLKSKVGEGFRVGRGGRSLRFRPALVGRALGSRGFRPRRRQETQNRQRRRQPFDFAGNRQGKGDYNDDKAGKRVL